MEIILDELREIDLLFRLADPLEKRALFEGDTRDQIQQHRIQGVTAQTARLRSFQETRLALPQLPEFPDEDEAPLVMER